MQWTSFFTFLLRLVSQHTFFVFAVLSLSSWFLASKFPSQFARMNTLFDKSNSEVRINIWNIPQNASQKFRQLIFISFSQHICSTAFFYIIMMRTIYSVCVLLFIFGGLNKKQAGAIKNGTHIRKKFIHRIWCLQLSNKCANYRNDRFGLVAKIAF